MEMTEPGIREILAGNIKKSRRKCGFSQEKLAEKAGISTPFVAMIEVSRKFPTPDVLDRIAGALDIKTYQLFAVPASPEEAMEQLRRDIVSEIKQTIGESVAEALKEALADNRKDCQDISK
jgi:transcriptional regulator with XRE-family HTH domain